GHPGTATAQPKHGRPPATRPRTARVRYLPLGRPRQRQATEPSAAAASSRWKSTSAGSGPSMLHQPQGWTTSVGGNGRTQRGRGRRPTVSLLIGCGPDDRRRRDEPGVADRALAGDKDGVVGADVDRPGAGPRSRPEPGV